MINAPTAIPFTSCKPGFGSVVVGDRMNDRHHVRFVRIGKLPQPLTLVVCALYARS